MGLLVISKGIQQLVWIMEHYKLTLMDLGSLSYPPKLCLKFQYECILKMQIAFLVKRQKLYQSLLLHSSPFSFGNISTKLQ